MLAKQMLKLLYISSENHMNFGVSKVVISLNNEIKKKKITSKFSNEIFEFFRLRPNIIHINGCWKVRLIFFFIFSKILGTKIVISPHGMMDPISLKQKSLKKKIALLLYQKFIFKNSDLVIVNSKIEKNNLLKVVSNISKIIIIPHGINIDRKFRIIENKKDDVRFVFFSRIHKSKNLDRLVKLWRKNYYLKKYNLDIYGEIVDKNYFSELKIKNNKNINYRGKLNNNIQKCLSNYDVFIHPSESENFGLVIYEALSSGLYLILNKKLKKNFLEKKKFAKNINFNPFEFKKAIQYVLQNKKKIKSVFYKRKSLNFIKNNYNWKEISEIYFKNYIKLI